VEVGMRCQTLSLNGSSELKLSARCTRQGSWENNSGYTASVFLDISVVRSVCRIALKASVATSARQRSLRDLQWFLGRSRWAFVERCGRHCLWPVQGFGVPWFCMGPWFSPIFYRTRRTCRYIISMIIILNAIVFWIFSLVAKGHVFGQEKLNYTLD
jgi:hypothetical protein